MIARAATAALTTALLLGAVWLALGLLLAWGCAWLMDAGRGRWAPPK